MNIARVRVVISLMFLFLGITGSTFAQEQSVEDVNGIDGVTKPFSDIELSFAQPGKIQKIFVKEGDEVQAGDVLVQQVDEIEQIQKKILKARSENMVPIELGEVELAQKQKDLEQLKKAKLKGATTQWEVEHASLAVDTALLSLKIREFDHQQDLLKLQSIDESIKKLTISSPIQGRVEKIEIEEGETAQALSPIIRIVKIDPLRIDLPVPVDTAVTVEPDQIVYVNFLGGTQLEGKVVRVSSVADAAATTLDVQIVLANTINRPAGERVSVLFDKP